VERRRHQPRWLQVGVQSLTGLRIVAVSTIIA
jgi:hypothetical protein